MCEFIVDPANAEMQALRPLNKWRGGSLYIPVEPAVCNAALTH
jgi:hypothetical protein